MKKQAFILGLVVLLSMPAEAGADIYHWKDANGVMHFSNQPPPSGVTLIEKIEERPYDAEADRRRIEEERRLRLERQKLEIEERKTATAGREREAQLKLEDANRRLEEARRLEQEARERAKGEDCYDDYYLRYGVCVGYPAYAARRHYYGPPGRSDLYREYYRENNSLYYKGPFKPVKPPAAPPPGKPGVTPAPRPEVPKSPAKPSKAPQAAEELLPKESGQALDKPVAPK
jgi:hypothetical protein